MTTHFSEYLFFIQFGPAILESVAVLVIELHDVDQKIAYASPLLETMFGYPRGSLMGQPLELLLRREDRAIHNERVAGYRVAPTTRTMNSGIWVDGVKKDGTTFKAQVSLCTQMIGKEDCVIACVADVTAAFNRQKPEQFHH